MLQQILNLKARETDTQQQTKKKAYSYLLLVNIIVAVGFVMFDVTFSEI